MSASKLAMLLVYGGTLFLSAILVFLIQLILGKMITPLMGGTPEVWSTCMVFFQAVLLAGYAYAHWSTTYLGPRTQAKVHLCLMVVPLLFLFPIWVNKGFIPDGNDTTVFNAGPIGTVLFLLLVSVGVPFFVVSASAPMLQKWFSSTDHPSASDPYFLYGASNLGSMGLLFAYPSLIEPGLGISNQRWVWTAGYLVLFALTALCAILMWQSPEAKYVPEPVDTSDPNMDEENHPLSSKVTWGRRFRWIALSLVPSSLLLGATNYMTTDIAPIPLLWVLPLALYLGTFIIVFSKTPRRIQDWLVGFIAPVFPGTSEKSLRNVIDGHKALILTLPLLILLLVFLMMAEGIQKPHIVWLIALHMVTLFVVAMVCHGELARDRPSAKFLTEFFMWMSFGGVIGGLLNSLFAPVFFDGYYEYPLAMVVACLLLPHLSNEDESKWGFSLDVALASLFILVGSLLIVVRLFDEDLGLNKIKLDKFKWYFVAMAGIIGMGLWYVVRRPKDRAARIMDLVLPLSLGFLTIGLIWGMDSAYLINRVLELPAQTYNKWIGRMVEVESRVERITGWTNTVIGWLGTPFNAKWELSPRQFSTIVSFGLPAILCYTFVERSMRFGLGVAMILIAGSFCTQLASDDKFQERGFFGVLKVETNREVYRNQAREVVAYDQVHRLVHGTTLHGKQYYAYLQRASDGSWRLDPNRPEKTDPLTYYHRTGPIGQVCEAYNPNPVGLGLVAGPFAGVYGFTNAADDPLLGTARLGVIGLGTGTMSTYARPGQTVVFYDIDPLVKKISFDPKMELKKDEEGKPIKDEKGNAVMEEVTPEYFTYVYDARKRGAKVELKLNDARLAIERQVTELEKEAEKVSGKTSGPEYDSAYKLLRNQQGYKILVVDAFSSDAIPMHLITLDALKLYWKLMRDDGIVCFHISNRYLDLQPVLANLVEQINKETGGSMAGVYENDQEHGISGKASSTWVMIARDKKYLSGLATRESWDSKRKQALGLMGEKVENWDSIVKKWEDLPEDDKAKTPRPDLGSIAAFSMLPMQPGLSGPAMCYALSGYLGTPFKFKDEDGTVLRERLQSEAPWKACEPDPKVGVWTDDYAPILRAFIWR